MEPLFSEKQLQDMSKENIITLIQAMQVHQKKQETEIQLLKEKTKELEFMNALLSDRLALAQRKQFGSSSEKYAEGYEQMDLFNEAEQEADPNAAEPEMEEIHPKSYKRKKPTGKKEEDLSAFETTEVIKHKLEGNDRFCPECGTKYKVVTTITECYLKLANKKNLIRKIEMDPETLDWKCLSEDESEIPRDSLSAGEKQLMIISILWALAICSKKKLPVIIDTPLSRMDSLHRTALITTYFPNAGEQTIILSTDSEIDEGYYRLMKNNIGDEFTLNYDEVSKSTSIQKGYLIGAKS